MEEFEEQLESLKQHILDASRQNWLFGAGISYDANIPLMYPLTDRVSALIQESDNENNKSIVDALQAELTENCHVEHYLSHLGDLIALSERSRNMEASLDGANYSSEQLNHCYREIVKIIGETMRYGYKIDGENETVGTIDAPIVEIDSHVRFIQALFLNKVNLERRSSISFFTTNYDTLLEDALALNKINVVDGFSGGAMGFWNADSEFSSHTGRAASCSLFKLHGSVDWHHDSAHGLVRARYGTKYLSNAADIMIYPQATKYVETQKDPFAALFSGLRSAITTADQNLLITCGYSFGDEHINSEIEHCLNDRNNKTTVVAFTDEKPEGDVIINQTLDRWLQHKHFGERVFVAGKNGLYNNSLTPCSPVEGKQFEWWKFSGLIEFIKSGEV